VKFHAGREAGTGSIVVAGQRAGAEAGTAGGGAAEARTAGIAAGGRPLLKKYVKESILHSYLAAGSAAEIFAACAIYTSSC